MPSGQGHDEDLNTSYIHRALANPPRPALENNENNENKTLYLSKKKKPIKCE